MTATCQLPDCASPCHRDDHSPGRYCAPLRCLCGGCPGFVELPEIAARVARTRAEVVAMRTDNDVEETRT